jgi:hypothetical protein
MATFGCRILGFSCHASIGVTIEPHTLAYAHAQSDCAIRRVLGLLLTNYHGNQLKPATVAQIHPLGSDCSLVPKLNLCANCVSC